MLGTIIFILIALIPAFISSYTRYTQRYLVLCFLVIFAFLALRYDFGNDYMSYYQLFDYIHTLSFQDLVKIGFAKDPLLVELGYNWLNRIIPNFFILVALLALLSSYTYYKYIRWYSPSTFIWLSVFIFLVSPEMMLIQSSAFRQTIAICFFLLSTKYMIDRNFWRFILLVLLGSIFHKSAILMAAVYFVATPKIWSDRVLISLVVAYLFFTFFGHYIFGVINRVGNLILPYYVRVYMDTLEGNKLESGLGFLVNSLFFLLIVWSHRKSEVHHTVITKLVIIGYLFTSLSLHISMIDRIGMYFNSAIIVALPYLVSLQKTKQLRLALILLIMLFYTYSFKSFFNSPTWGEHYSTYKINLHQVF